jgi:hypothetical protein
MATASVVLLLQLPAMVALMLRTKVLALLSRPEQYGLMGALDRLVAVFAQTAAPSMPIAAQRLDIAGSHEGGRVDNHVGPDQSLPAGSPDTDPCLL